MKENWEKPKERIFEKRLTALKGTSFEEKTGETERNYITKIIKEVLRWDLWWLHKLRLFSPMPTLFFHEHLHRVLSILHIWFSLVTTQARCGDPGQGGVVSVGPIWHTCIAIRPAKHPTYMLSQSFLTSTSLAKLSINPEFCQPPVSCSCQVQIFWYLQQTACLYYISL